MKKVMLPLVIGFFTVMLSYGAFVLAMELL